MIASIADAAADDDYILHITLTNDNEMMIDFKQLFEYKPFKALADISKWKTMQVNEHSLSWGEGSTKVEFSLNEILNYFA